MAVDAAGSVYVTDRDNRVVKLPAGSSTQTVLPITGLASPSGMAVDAAGSVHMQLISPFSRRALFVPRRRYLEIVSGVTPPSKPRRLDVMSV